jgi:uncharacterized membrane protein
MSIEGPRGGPGPGLQVSASERARRGTEGADGTRAEGREAERGEGGPASERARRGAGVPADREIDRLERLLGRLLFAGVVTSASFLGAGVVLWMLGRRDGFSAALLHSGLILLMATPVARVIVSFVEYVRARDWFFAMTTLGVLGVLLATVLVAIRTALGG